MAEKLLLTPKQEQMIRKYADVDEIFYGGQAGGGKSEGLLMFALQRRIEYPGSAGLMLRRTVPQLEKSLIRKSKLYYKPFAKWKEQKKHWQFKSEFGGGIQEFGHCERDNDVYQYDSSEYADISVDEAGHFTEFQVTYLTSRLRPPQEGVKGLLRLGSNPGNIGHYWLKARYVDVARNKVIKVWDNDLGTYKTRLFLPATLDDNTLMSPEKRQQYRAWLAGLPEDEKRRLMGGDWDYVPGAAFSELNRNVQGYNRDEIKIPRGAPVVMGLDWGFGKPFSVGWYWIDYDDRLWRFAEWYGWSGKPDTGMRMAPSQVARGILQREKALGIAGRVESRPSDPSVFGRTANYKSGGLGPTYAEMFSDEGVYLTPSDNDRMMGKGQMHERLRKPEEEDVSPMLMVAHQCEHFWRTVPTLPLDEKNIEDVDTDAEDHVYDEVRYVAMSRILSPSRPKPEETEVQKLINKVLSEQPPVEELEEIYDL